MKMQSHVHPWTLQFSDPEVARSYFSDFESSLSSYTSQFIVATLILFAPAVSYVAVGHDRPAAAALGLPAVIVLIICACVSASPSTARKLSRLFPSWITGWNACRACIFSLLLVGLSRVPQEALQPDRDGPENASWIFSVICV